MKNLPEKIYVHEISAMELGVKIPYSVEYVHKDAFVEKVLKYLDENFYFNNLHYAVENNTFNCKEEMFEDFKKYIKGE